MQEKYKTIKDLQNMLSELPQNATIGFTSYDEDGDAWGYSNFRIMSKNRLDIKYGKKDLDYYID